MTTCTFLKRHFNREAYSVIKKSGNEIKCWPKSPSKWLAARTSLCIFDQAASLERGFCNIFKCTRVLVFVAMPSQSPSRYHLTVYKHVCMVGNASISANRRICGFTHIQVCCVRKGLNVTWFRDHTSCMFRRWGAEIELRPNLLSDHNSGDVAQLRLDRIFVVCRSFWTFYFRFVIAEHITLPWGLFFFSWIVWQKL